MSGGWDDILEAGETLVWQGQPDARIKVEPKRIPSIVFGLIFAGLALIGMISAAKAGDAWAFGLIHFFAGTFIALGPLVIGPYMRTRTWYSLTSRRAFFARDLPILGRSLNVLEIAPNSHLDFDGGEPGIILFRDPATSLNGGRVIERPAFDRIHGAKDIFQHIRDIQRGIA